MDACSSDSSVFVALQLFLQGQQLGKRRIRIRLFVAARRLVGAPCPRRPVVVAAIAIPVTPRPALRPLATFGTVATGLAISALLTVLALLRLMALRSVRSLLHLAVGRRLGLLTCDCFALVVAAITPASTPWLALAVRSAFGGRRSIDNLAVSGGAGRRLARSLPLGGNNRTFGTTAAAAPFALARTTFAGRTAGPPHLDCRGLGRSC